MNLNQMEQWVIAPALKRVGLYSEGAARMILLTGLVESRYKYVKQVGTGPAVSFWQIEPNTANDHYVNYLDFRPALYERVQAITIPQIDLKDQLLFNMAYAVVMARLKYWRSKDPMPLPDQLEGQANFWKKVYNTEQGAGTVEKFLDICQGVQQELP